MTRLRIRTIRVRPDGTESRFQWWVVALVLADILSFTAFWIAIGRGF